MSRKREKPYKKNCTGFKSELPKNTRYILPSSLWEVTVTRACVLFAGQVGEETTKRGRFCRGVYVWFRSFV